MQHRQQTVAAVSGQPPRGPFPASRKNRSRSLAHLAGRVCGPECSRSILDGVGTAESRSTTVTVRPSPGRRQKKIHQHIASRRAGRCSRGKYVSPRSIPATLPGAAFDQTSRQEGPRRKSQLGAPRPGPIWTATKPKPPPGRATNAPSTITSFRHPSGAGQSARSRRSSSTGLQIDNAPPCAPSCPPKPKIVGRRAPAVYRHPSDRFGANLVPRRGCPPPHRHPHASLQARSRFSFLFQACHPANLAGSHQRHAEGQPAGS